MYVTGIRLTNFRSYRDASFGFSPGLNLIVGGNASGKTNLLEGAYYALRAASPRTARDDKLVRWGQSYARAEAWLTGDRRIEVFYGTGQGRRVRVNGVDAATVDEVRRLTPAFIFVPESLLLVKGSPARRRAHIDALGAGLDPRYLAATVDLQQALRQRNAQLASVRAGAAAESLDPWDAQLAKAGTELGVLRRDLIHRLAAPFSAAAAALAPGGERFALRLQAALESLDYRPERYLAALRARRAHDVARAMSLLGPHRDDLRFVELGREDASAPGDERDLRVYGSQGEQRTAVLALLLSERAAAAELTGQIGPLFLDDVMSELDERRRRLLITALGSEGQAIVTATTTAYFTDAELSAAHVIELGPVAGAQGEPAAESETEAAPGARYARAASRVETTGEEQDGPPAASSPDGQGC